MKLAVLGATSPLGQELVKQAIVQGYSVRILSRREPKKGLFPNSVEIVQGDYFDKAAILETLQGTEAVLSVIGPPQHRKTSLKPNDFGQAMQQLIQVMNDLNIERIINVASAGTRWGNEPYGWGRKVVRFLLSFIAPIVIPSKEQELQALENSSLKWTTVRPPLIQTGMGGQLKASDQATQGIRVDQALLAHFLLQQLESNAWVRRAPFVAS